MLVIPTMSIKSLKKIPQKTKTQKTSTLKSPKTLK